MGNKIYVGNLPYMVDEKPFRDNELKETFSQFGEITEAVVITEQHTGRSKGFGFVTFAKDEDAQKAVSEMNGKDLGGRAITVNEARPRADESEDNSGDAQFKDAA